jgi:hypothetical protein
MSDTQQAPNLFELVGEGVSVNYSTTGLDGRPQFNLRTRSLSHNLTGDDITVEPLNQNLGSLITVSLDGVPDRDSVTFSVLLPAINLHGQVATFETLALETIHRTSIGGPWLVQGALQIYRPIPLKGTARAVKF